METSELTHKHSGVRVTVHRTGSGAPVLFIPGELALLESEKRFLERLGQRFQVVTAVHPAFYNYDDTVHLEESEDLAFFYLDLLDALGIPRAHLVGHSLGAMVAAEIASLDPHYVDRLVLISPLGMWQEEAPIPDFYVIPRREQRQYCFADPESEVAREALPDRMPNEEVESAFWQRYAAAGKVLWGLPVNLRLLRRLHRVKSPTLVIGGEKDRLTAPIYAQLYAQKVPGADVVLLPGSAHYPHLEEPDAVLRELERFLG
jgi:pimeloyl-ACP methyl ester carboxylesterase